MNAELSFDLDDSAVTGDVVFGEGGAQGELTASLNTASDGFMVETVKYSREGNGWRVTPTYVSNKNNNNTRSLICWFIRLSAGRPYLECSSTSLTPGNECTA